MYKKFTASRISRDNVLFPPEIILEDEYLTLNYPGLFASRCTNIPYENISHISSVTPLIGFTTLSFYAFGKEVRIHGFTVAEVKEIKRFIASKQNED